MNKSLFTLLLAGTICGTASTESLLKPINDKIEDYGTLSGHLNGLTMYNRFSRKSSFPQGNEGSGTLSLTLGFESKEFYGFSFGAKYVYGDLLFGGGSAQDGDSRGNYWNGNGQVNVFNELWVNYNFTALGLFQTNLKIGRQVPRSTDGNWAGLDYMPVKNIRHKDQAFQGISLTTEDIENFKITVGHIDRFSNWGWTDYNSDMFYSVEDAIMGAYDNALPFDPNRPSAKGYAGNKGMQFISATYTGFDSVKLTAYDYYAHDIYNTIGGHADVKLSENWLFKAHYSHQNSIGEATDLCREYTSYKKHKSNLVDLSLTATYNDIDLQFGVLSILGNNDGDQFKSFITPFDFIAVPSDQLLVHTDSYAAGADSYYIQARGAITDKLWALVMYTYTHHQSNTFNAQEIDMILSYSLTSNLKVSVLGALAKRHGHSGTPNSSASDIRFGFTYNF